MPAKIPVLLVTGFLGSGKTTFLRRLAADHPEWRMIFLVNEFADTSIDELTLDTTGVPTQSVVGGSLFCECKAGEFVRVMKEQVLAEHQNKPLDAIVIETSGIANPQAIGDLMNLHGLGEWFEVRSVICVVAAKRFLTLVKNLPAIEAQVTSSDLIILNKTDLVDEYTLGEVEETIHRLSPEVRILRAEQCRIDFQLGDTLREFDSVPLFPCSANPFRVEEVTWPEERSIDDARTWLETIPPTVLRIKGYLKASGQTWCVERSVDTLEVFPVDRADTDRLVLIAHRDHENELQKASEFLHVSSL